MEDSTARKFLACTVSPGMFPDEYVVEIEVEGAKFSLFVDSSDVQVVDTESGRGLLRVWVQDAAHDLIALPSETLEQGRRYLQYPVEKLRSA